ASTSWAAYGADVSLPPRNATLSIAYTNDGVVNGVDRNLLVDRVAVAVAPPPNQPPTASFTASASGLSASFDASASRDPEGSALTYAWSFGDGTSGAGVAPTHAYAAAGSYVVKLTVSDGSLTGSSSSTVTAVQPNRAPVAALSCSATDLTATCDGSASSDPDGDALSYAYDFGDGATGEGPQATHTYATAGNHTIVLTVSDGKLSSTARAVVSTKMPNRAPIAQAACSAVNLTATCDASGSSDPDGDALTYAWAFGDGATATGVRATHAYAAAGSHTIQLTVSDGKLSSGASATVTAVQPNRAPTAAMSVSGSGLSFGFDGRSSSDPDGDALSYLWSFGDGATATGAQATHAYAAGGSYTATLTVTDPSGATGRASAAVSAVAPPPPAPAAPFSADFANVKGNEWWVQADVSGSEAISAVCASVDGGACQALKLQSWGSWAAVVHAPTGSKVTFTATGASGRSDSSVAYDWPSA